MRREVISSSATRILILDFPLGGFQYFGISGALFAGTRQFEPEITPFTHIAFQSDPAAMSFNHQLAERQTKAGRIGSTLFALLHLEKFTEYLLAIFR
jgi:hypothetical protein